MSTDYMYLPLCINGTSAQAVNFSSSGEQSRMQHTATSLIVCISSNIFCVHKSVQCHAVRLSKQMWSLYRKPTRHRVGTCWGMLLYCHAFIKMLQYFSSAMYMAYLMLPNIKKLFAKHMWLIRVLLQ